MDVPASRCLLTLLVAVVISAANPPLVAQCAAEGPSKQNAREKPPYPVKVAVNASKIDGDGKQVLEVILQMDEQWSIFGNPVGVEDLAAAQTVLKVSCEKPLTEVTVHYPKGRVVKDKVIGDYTVFEGKVRLVATIKRVKGDDAALDVTVRVYPINLIRGVCTHLPKTLKVKVQ